MKAIPILYCRDMQEAIHFYTGVLDFKLKYAESSADDLVIDLINGDAEIQLTRLEGDQKAGVAVNICVSGVDVLFQKYLMRGLDTSQKSESPVHQGPVNQTWGKREFYVTDPSGNTLRFGTPL